MTGPRSTTVHPHRRRGRLLLPFLAAIVLAPLGCTSDKFTEPTTTHTGQLAVASGPHPRARLYSATANSVATLKSKASFGMATAFNATGPSVLILSDLDGASTNALADTLSLSGFQVSVRSAPEWSYDGTDPVLDGFDVVIHLNGSTYDVALTPAGQRTLKSFVLGGGGYIGAQWNPTEWTPEMADLVLTTYGGVPETENCANCQITFQAVTGKEAHPVLQGLPSSFTFLADGHDAGPVIPELSGETLMQTAGGGPGVVVRQFGAGKVVNFSFAPNYPFDENGMPRDPTTLMDEHVKGLYVNAAKWLAGSATGSAQPQSITFDAITDKIYGDRPFLATVFASSDLPVSLVADGQCTVFGTTVTITGAGSCTITAIQAGNADFQPAQDVVRSFAIAKALATMSVGTTFTYDGTVKAATIFTNPAGLTGVTVTYSQYGIPVGAPDNAGVYDVVATLDNPNYEAPQATGTLTINKATPVISWSPASINSTTPLGLSQLNATAVGVDGSSVPGEFVYTPAEGTILSAGTHTLSTEFRSGSPNYTGANKTVTINVASSIVFSGFFLPVRNLPVVNVVNAGSTVPLKFSIGGFQGLNILQGPPTSVDVPCFAGSSKSTVQPGLPASNGLTAVGAQYSYNWRTEPSWAGTCRKVVLTLVDGSTHEALFSFTPKASDQPSAKGKKADKPKKSQNRH
jgi:MBG domain-containing protein